MDKRLIVLLLLLLAVQTVESAELTGTAYTEDLQIARFSLLTINTTPEQRIILQDGSYNLELPQGSYVLKVMYNDATGNLEDSTIVTIIDGGKYSYDFILFPSYSTSDLPNFDDIAIPETASHSSSLGAWPAVLLIVLIVIAVYFFNTMKSRSKHNGKHGGSTTMADSKIDNTVLESPTNESLQQVLGILKSEGGRMTQREIRKQLPYSEAKISMMLTELEHKKKIERIKRGRGNLIVLK